MKFSGVMQPEDELTSATERKPGPKPKTGVDIAALVQALQETLKSKEEEKKEVKKKKSNKWFFLVRLFVCFVCLQCSLIKV